MRKKEYRSELPHEWSYKVLIYNKGIIVDGAKGEPTVKIWGPKFHVEYGLISETYSPECDFGSLSETQRMAIEDLAAEWIESQLPILRRDAQLHHIVQFQTDSSCYYDFLNYTLIGATGKKEKIGALDGSAPCRISDSERAIITLLTRAPHSWFSFETVKHVAGASTDRSMRTTWSRLRQYDPSLKQSFLRESDGYIYRGNPQLWFVGNGFLQNNDVNPISVTIEKVFQIFDYLEVLAIPEGRRKQSRKAGFTSTMQSIDKLAFLGIPTELENLDSTEAERICHFNECASVDLLELLYRNFNESISASWDRMYAVIFDNLKASIIATSYYNDTGELPKSARDLQGYSPPVVRSMTRKFDGIKKLISETIVGPDFFQHCNKSVTADNAVDCIVALTLSCLYYCQSSESEMVELQRGRFHENLLMLIHAKFNFTPPNGSGYQSTHTDEEFHRLICRLLEMRENYLEQGDYENGSKINDLLNEFHYGDSNDLMPHSHEPTR